MSDFWTTTDIRRAPGQEHMIDSVLLGSATSGRSQRVENPPKWADFLLSNRVKADASLTSGGLD